MTDTAERLERAEEEIARIWSRIASAGEPTPYLSSAEAADYLNMSTRWVQLHAEKLRGKMVGNRLRFAKADLDRYIESRELSP